MFSLNIIVFIFTILYSNRWILSFSTIPKTNYLLVLGAGVNKSGQPSKILEDRLGTAAKYAHKFDPKFIILSGTQKGEFYNEPSSMQNSLLLNNVVRESMKLDPSGFSTFHSCINFKNKFGKKEIVIISQKFHLYRSILISRIIGLPTFGLAAENHKFKKIKTGFWYFREFFAIPYNLLRIFRYLVQNH